MACDENSNTPWGENVDFETRYTGDNIECGDDVIVRQGESLRTVIQTLANRSCESDNAIQSLSEDFSDGLDIVEAKANDAIAASSIASYQATTATIKSDEAILKSNEALSKSNEALNEIANLPDPTIRPSNLNVFSEGGIPTRGTSDTWASQGLRFDANFTQNTIAYRYTGGRLKVGSAVDNNDAVTLSQLNDAQFQNGIHENNTGDSFVNNSPRSLVMNSANSKIDLLVNSQNQSNLIFGSRLSQMVGVTRVNSIISSEGATISNGYGQSIIASLDCELKGTVFPPGSVPIEIGSSHNRSIIASSESSITGRRQNAAVIASHRVTFDDYTNVNQFKWNVAVIAGRECKVKEVSSYTIVTGQGTVSNASAQVVMGTFNLDEPSVSVFSPNKKILVVGNGIANSYTPDGTPDDVVRSNAFEVKYNGEAWVQNGIEVDKAGGGVIMKSPNGQKWLLSVDNNGNPIFTSV